VIVLEIIAVIAALICLSPFYFLVANAFKPVKDLTLDPAALPHSFYLDNFTNSFKILNYPKAFLNSLIVTVTSNIVLIVVGAMAAYRLVRHNSKLNKFIFLMFISAMVIPFQSIMLPMVKVAASLKLINTYYGVLFVYLGFGVSMTMFLFHGFIKTVPVDIEEAAIVDGCSPFGTFWKIVFPLLKPVCVTVLILNSLWIWNDFLLPLLVIPSEKMRTIPLAINTFFGQYTKKWDLAMAALVLSIIPVVILFLSLQKYIIEGIVSGSVKG
jgi:raffinose/stachyose/melibiose transport system permease protein